MNETIKEMLDKVEFPNIGKHVNGKESVCDMLKFMEYVTQRVRQELNLPPKQKKHEEIEKMAWDLFQKIYIAALNNNEAGTNEQLTSIRSAAYKRAEEFYNFAKEKKQEENSNDN